MKVFVMDRRRLRVFRVRQPGSGGLRLVVDVWAEPILAREGERNKRDVPTLAVLNENEHGSFQ